MNNFWKVSTWTLLLVISLLSGCTAHISLVQFTPWLAVKTACILTIIILIVQLPTLLALYINKFTGGKS